MCVDEVSRRDRPIWSAVADRTAIRRRSARCRGNRAHGYAACNEHEKH